MSDPKNNRRVVVTGLGVVSSIGIGWEDFWKNLLDGKSGISKLTAFDVSKHDRQYVGEIKDFDPAQFINKKKVKTIGRASQLAIAGVKLALKDAKISREQLSKERVGICLGTTMGESQVIEQIVKHSVVNKERVQKNRVSIYPANAMSINVADFFKLKGENLLFANACAAGNYAVARGFDLIRSGRANVVIAGGADALSRIAFTGFGRLFAMAPEKCQPFDKNRKGMMLGEGAGFLILESLENATNRNASIYSEILGYGLSCDAKHMTNPSVEGIVKGISRSLLSSGINKDGVDYISAHGTGTKENDKAESEAFRKVFGSRLKDVPVSSIKSMLGHTMGAAAALETIACCLAIKFDRLPPTMNWENQDPECDLDCVPNKSREHKVDFVINNSQAFGGNNACLVIGGKF